MSSPAKPSDQVDDEEEDEALLPDAEKSKEGEQNAAAAADEDDDALFEDDEIAKQAAFSGQINEDMRLMHETFDTEQSERLSLFRSVAFKGPAIKRVLGNVGMNNPNPAALPMIGGVAKVFVAEMVEKAREIQKAKGETGALAPEHLREAYRQYSEEYGRVGPAQPMKGKLRFVR